MVGWFWKYGRIALVVLERSSGTQLVFFKKLDLHPSAEDDVGKAEDDENGLSFSEVGWAF